jgi:curli production assembly/transport component CsgG
MADLSSTMSILARLTLFAVLLACLGGGCASTVQPFETEPARPGTPSDARAALTDLPPPQDQIVAAVYRFRDQTGQYKAKETGSTFSTAVTQGATSVLVSSLKESKWFVPIERKGLSNLLNERDIIRSIRAQHGNNNQALPPLLYAGVMLEGGIVGYDTNVITAGGGLRLFGIGGSGELREDRVTIYLRAVSTKTGRVLASVNTTKTIVSQKLDGGAFRYVDTDALLETEAGFSYNEPTLVAVKEAIDAATRSLVIEGTKTGAWSFKDPQQGASAVDQYEEQVRRAERYDAFDRLLQDKNRRGLGIEVAAGGMRYQGDYRRPQTEPSLSLALRHSLSPYWTAGIEGSVGRIAADGVFQRETLGIEARTSYYLTPRATVSPFLRVAAGVQSQYPFTFRPGDTLFPVAGASAGLEYMVTPRVGVSTALDARFSFRDDLDGASVGRYTDSILRVDVGVSYYLPW